jgi:alkanesulfonate monooxygenase SsuD/methylene tetrahydromethanopterin reductase-like flavin-dependent oxidoreductase (luciferase family)
MSNLVWGLLTVPQSAAGERDGAAVYQRTLEIADAAASGGFDVLYYPEHHGRDDQYPSAPLTLAALVAGRHRSIRVATGVALLPLHNPVTFCEQAALLDVLSEGRLHRLGVAIGDLPAEYAALGVPHAEMIARFEASLRVVTRLWRGETVSAAIGDSMRIVDARVRPSPISARVPLAIGAMSVRGVERAARMGLPWIADPMNSLEVLEPLAERYWSLAGGSGEIVLMRQCWIADDPEAIASRWWPHVRASIFGFSRSAKRLRGEPEVARAESADELRLEHFASRFMLGNASEVHEQCLAAAHRLGADEVVLRFGFQTGPEHGAVLAAIGEFARLLLDERGAPARPDLGPRFPANEGHDR